MERYQEIERELIKIYRKNIWSKFVKAICDYDMIKDGDKIAVCISGGKDSALMAKCFQELKRHRKKDFELEFIVMDPGYAPKNREKIINNCKLLNIPITMFETSIFASVERIEENPCYICARMRRGYLYEKAKELGCNKIALGHHFNDVIETIVMGMFYGAQFQTMMPKINSTSHPGMELIRPMYLIKEEDIIKWRDRNNLDFLACACKMTDKSMYDENLSKRREVKELIKRLKEGYDNIDINIFNSAVNVNLGTMISFKGKGMDYHFMDDYDERREKMVKDYEEKNKNI